MFCPDCGASIDDNCESCYSCGKEFKHVSGQEPAQPVAVPKQTSDKKKNKPDNKFSAFFKKIRKSKITWIIIISAVIILVTLLIAFFLRKPHPVDIADKLSQKLGSEIVTIERNAKVHVNTSSASTAINAPKDFDYIYESEKLIKVDGVKVPEWTITFYAVDNDITRIYYRDYTQQKKYYKGKKLKKECNFSEIKDCSKLRDVEELIDLDPVSITYFVDGTKEYRYMYYFVNGEKDEVRKEYTIKVDGKNKVLSADETSFDKININIR